MPHIKKIVFKEDKEAAEFVDILDKESGEVITSGWFSRCKHFFGQDEALARFDGSTHKRCATEKCGVTLSREWAHTVCDPCLKKIKLAEYAQYPKLPWTGESHIYSIRDEEYFRNSEELSEYLYEVNTEVLFKTCVTEEDLLLVHCYPEDYRILNAEYWEDCIVEEQQELPEEILILIDELNEEIRALNPLCWTPGEIAVLIDLNKDKSNEN